MVDNLPVLYRNIMDGLPTNFSRDVFLWAVDKFDGDEKCYRAEEFAREADQVTRSTKAMLAMSAMPLSDEQEADLLRFFQARLANYRMGGNVKSAMPEFYEGDEDGQ